jgi:hypothetical protein
VRTTTVALLGVTALAVAACVQLWGLCAAGRGLPMWDPAEHGLAGVILARDLRQGHALEFLLGLNRQVLWPFVHSLLLVPWVLTFGSDVTATDRLSSLLYAGAVVATFLAGLRLHAERGAWVGCAAAMMVLLAPHYRLYGTLTMLEMPGAFLLALTMCLHFRALRDDAPRWLLKAAGTSTTALVLCKYNYGLLWLAPLALHEWISLPPATRADMIGRAWASARSRHWLRPFPLIMAGSFLAILAIQVTGGGVLDLAGRRISVRSAGNPAYAFYVVAFAWAIVRLRRAGGLGEVMRRMSPRQAILTSTVVIPLAIWFLVPYPNRVRALIGFAVNRDSGIPLLSWEALSFYPRAFVLDYSPAPLVGWIVWALALLPPRLLTGRRGLRGDPAGLLLLALWVGLIATAGHHYRQPRFLFTTALLVWLSAARNAVCLLETALEKVSPAAGVRESTWALGLAALLAWGALGAPAARDTLALHRAFNAPPLFEPVLDLVIAHVERAGEPSVLLGYANEMSPALLRWHGLLTRPTLPERRMPEAPGAIPLRPSEADLAGRLEALRRSGRPVIAALPVAGFPGETPDYRDETRADSATAARLAADPEVVVEHTGELPSSGFRVTTFRFAPMRRGDARSEARGPD